MTDFDPLLLVEIDRIVADGADRAISQATAQVFEKFEGFLTHAEQNFGNRDELAQVHEKVGRAMQRAVLNSYAQVVTARKAGIGLDYRADVAGKHHRYAGGALKRALENPEMVQANAQGIGFIDTAILRQEAAHWARLNFGAGDPGKGTHGVQLRIFDQFIGTVDFDEGVRPPVLLPPGFFFNPSKGWVKPSPGGHRDMFFVAGRGAPGSWRPVKIQGRHFLEAGLDRLRKDLPVEYENLVSKWLSRSIEETGH